MMIDLGRVGRLKAYIQALQGEQADGLALYRYYQGDLEKVTPQEVFEIFTGLLDDGQKPAEILTFLDKIINVFHKSLSSYAWRKPPAGSFADVLRQENAALVERLDQISDILTARGAAAARLEIAANLRDLLVFNNHYLKKENILFPYMEKKARRFAGLSIMWALHDEARSRLKAVINMLENGIGDETDWHVEIGQLFFALHGLEQKEELILLPTASELFDAQDWAEMTRQSYEYEFPLIEPPAPVAQPAAAPAGPDLGGTSGGSNAAGSSNGSSGGNAAAEALFLRTETGSLDFEQAILIFNALPVDLSFVDENNQVRYFTRPRDRIFPRSPAVIGRDVRNCHPPASVEVVEEIVASFRAGKQDKASFWLDMRGRKILIQYFALRSDTGIYKGVLEVSQDITEIQQLTGERRLLAWEG
jgi:DUF438 domain-containing protein